MDPALEMSPYSKIYRSGCNIEKNPSLTKLSRPDQQFNTPTRRFNRPDK